MDLFERDYKKITPEETAQYQAIRASKQERIGDITFTSCTIFDYPKAVRHHLQLFPNNYLDVTELDEKQLLQVKLNGFATLLDSDPQKLNERAVLEFIRQQRAYFIVGSILKDNYQFGHHGAFLFPEFELGTSYKVDYLLVGNGSGGWEFVFVEFELPKTGSTLKDGDLGEAFRKGLRQIEAWDAWLDSHFGSMREVFDKAKKPGVPLPSEFVNLDKSRMHFVVVAGRRADFVEKTYRLRRKNEVLILHYDNLVDFARSIIGKHSY